MRTATAIPTRARTRTNARTRTLVAGFSIAAAALLAGTGCPMPNNGGTGGMTTNTTGDATAGQATYSNRCATCHSLGSFDSQGFAGDLANHSNQIVNNLSSINGAMSGITLTDTEIADLQAFIAQN